MKPNDKKLKAEYETVAPTANRFLDELLKQFRELLAEKRIPLAAPIEFRLKSWSSIEEKLKRKALKLKTITDLNDLVGVRLILLFSRDVERASQLLAEHFTLLKREDTSHKLTENQFGYASLHCIIEMPEEWLSVPSFRPLRGLKAEIQVRTMAQHIWAAASHILQYKQEAGIPMPLRRTVHRVSALLETVDLEFDRVLAEKEKYKESLDEGVESKALDVVSLEKVMDAILPLQNKDDWEDYASLVKELEKDGISSPEQVKQILRKRLKQLIAYDKERVKEELASEFNGCNDDDEIKRVQKGVYFTHSGLLRQALELEQNHA